MGDKLTIKELEEILKQPNCRLSTVINTDGSIGSVLTACGKEVDLLKNLYWAVQQMGQARKHNCPGFDCATCNTTGVFEAFNALEEFYNPDPPSGSVMPNGNEA